MTGSWLNLAVALGLGLLIGLERERSKGVGPGRRTAGIRTFAMATLLGGMAVAAGGAVLLAVATGGVIVLAVVSAALARLRGEAADPGITTEIGLVAAPLLGGLAMHDMAGAAGLAVVIAVLFAAKAPLHGFVTRALSDAEVSDLLILAVATLVVWPLLPDRYLGPFDAVNPYRLWLLVVLVLALGAAGHVAVRWLGARHGLPIAGLAGGFVSSTATIGAMAGRAARDPRHMGPAVAAAALSTVATFVQMALVLLATSRATLLAMAPALLAGGVVAALYGLVFSLRAWREDAPADADVGRALSLRAAVILAALLGVMLIVAAAARHWFGEAAMVVATSLGGFADAHAAGIAMASLVASGQAAPADAVLPILAALSTNCVSKAVMAIGGGERGFATRTIGGIALSLGAAWVAAWALPAGLPGGVWR